MRVSSIAVVLVLVGCGTKKNPEACCIDEADCASIGLPVGSNCEDGLLCRGHRCVEVNCDVSAQCDLSAPYCIGAPDGVCQESCADDMQCPGFGQSTDDKFCEAGACVACRAAMNDCTSAEPICDMGQCRRCAQHTECGSGVCNADGSCALESEIAYVAPIGSMSSSCTRTDPCTLARSFQTGLVERPYILLDGGSYQLAGTLTVNSRRAMIGKTSARPTVTNTMTGPIMRLAFGGDLTVDNLEITGAKTSVSPGFDGYGIDCPDLVQGKLHVVRSTFTQNQLGGVLARNCTVDVTESSFTNNPRGVETIGTATTIARSTFTNNTEFALNLDAGLYQVTNSFIFRNAIGVELFGTTAGSNFQFNTIADNQTTGVSCQSIQGFNYQVANNLIVRNGTNTSTDGSCVFDASMTTNDVTAVKFNNASSVPYDYHLMPGSIAVDQISTSSQTKDFDGESRPFGAGHDYGADELH